MPVAGDDIPFYQQMKRALPVYSYTKIKISFHESDSISLSIDKMNDTTTKQTLN